MTSVALWQVSGNGPRKLLAAAVDLEAQLEAWIEADPDLVQFGLRIVARQARVDAGPLDLLALDPQGRWCVIEIKRDAVDRATVAQIQDYAACLSEMTEQQLRACLAPHIAARSLDLDEELRRRDAIDSLDPKNRQVVMFVVGTARSPGLERVLRFLGDRHGLPIFSRVFSVFVTSQGDRVLVRETADGEVPEPSAGRWQPASLHDIRAIADAGGLGELFDLIKAAADRSGLQSRPWKRSVMFAPATDGRRCLFTLWTTPQKGGLQIYVEPKAFAEFFPVTETQALEAIGPSGYRIVGIDAARAFAHRLEMLLKSGPNEPLEPSGSAGG